MRWNYKGILHPFKIMSAPVRKATPYVNYCHSEVVPLKIKSDSKYHVSFKEMTSYPMHSEGFFCFQPKTFNGVRIANFVFRL